MATKRTPKKKPAKKIAKAEVTPAAGPTYYKVTGKDGESIHGGSLTWSMPANDKPGDWHEVTGRIEKCARGLHLTTEPARWWKPKCRVFIVEAEGIIGEPDGDAKVVARRARLVRELSAADLVAVQIFHTGSHVVRAGMAITLGSSSVEAHGSSRVVAHGSSRVVARGSSSVEAWGSSRVVARGSSSVEAWGSSSVVARESSSVVARESSRVEAWGSSSVVAWGSSSVEAWGSSSVVAWGSSSVVARGSSRVEALESSRVVARGSSSVEAWESSRVVARGSSSVVAWGSSSVEANDHVTVLSHVGGPTVTLAGFSCWVDHRERNKPPVVTIATAAPQATTNGQTQTELGA